MVDIDGDSLIKGLNKTGENYKSEIFVVTLDDNLTHPYFTDIQLDKDNVTPIGSCVLVAPKEKELSKYWLNYSGPVVVSFKIQGVEHENTNTKDYFTNKIVPSYTKYQEKLEKKMKSLTEETDKEIKELKQNLINNYYNFSFIGKITRIKERGKKFIIYLSDLGWKFMQKVPKEFRSAFIANQSLDDAFQAMCEFMGVEFAYSIEDLHEYNFGADGYSVEKDGETIEDVPQILKEWSNNFIEEQEANEDANQLTPDPEDAGGLTEYNQKKKELENILKIQDTSDVGKKISDTNSSLYKSKKETDDPNDKTENKEDENKKTLEDKIAEYQEDFDEKIRTLFIGNGYYLSDLTHPVLDYNAITIEPKASTTGSNMSSVGSAGSNTNSNNSNGSMSIDEYRDYWSDKVQSSNIGINVNFINNNISGNLQKGKFLLGR